MYIKQLTYRNVGPLRHIDLDMPFTDDGCPKPLVVVGENGSGKSLLVSNIVDALVEAAATRYANVRPDDASSQYFKIISPSEVSIGERYLAAHISFDGGEEYLFKSGQADFESCREDLQVVNDRLNWKEKSNYKGTTFTAEKVERYFSEGAYCYFGPNRYEMPLWMGDRYLDSPRNPTSLSANIRYSERLEEPIIVQHCLSDTEKWLLDVVSDSRADVTVFPDGGAMSIALNLQSENSSRLLNGAAVRDLAERILSAVLGKEVRLAMGGRRSGNRRLSVLTRDGRHVIAPSFGALSTGQLALFDIFSTLVRYMDRKPSAGSIISVESIKGIAVIDEADLHLHTALQRDALPSLIAMFPHVQFIITTHSPLLLIGLEEMLGQDGMVLLELPEGDCIGLEAFSEFQRAYECYRETRLHKHTIEEEVLKHSGLPLVITEGKTDWMHLKAARIALEGNLSTHGLTMEEFDILEYSEDMGGDELKAICKKIARVPQTRPIVFIADSDKREVTNSLSAPDGQAFKKHGNGVYSFVIPKPQFRKKEDGICVEQLYTDDVLKTAITCNDGVERRLYLTTDFDEYGRSQDGYFWNGAGKSRHNGSIVIDGDSSKVVSSDCNDSRNYALTKAVFAQYILDNAVVFKDNRFESFIPVLSSISDAIRDWRADFGG